MSKKPKDDGLVECLSRHNRTRIDLRNAAYTKLLPDLLAVAKNPSSHWRYVLTATVIFFLAKTYKSEPDFDPAILESARPPRSATTARNVLVPFVPGGF